jgi:hypothetical protein
VAAEPNVLKSPVSTWFSTSAASACLFLQKKAAEISPEMQIPEKCFSRQCKRPCRNQLVGSFGSRDVKHDIFADEPKNIIFAAPFHLGFS